MPVSTYDAIAEVRPARPKVASEAVPMDCVTAYREAVGKHCPNCQVSSYFPPAQLAMSNANNSQERTFGYLSTVESAEYGYFGGYLIVSGLGRPLEFHCTAPIRPSRAQQILYGPTLQPYLLGEQICGALLGTAKLSPAIILTDCEAVLHARSRSSVPIAFVLARHVQLPHNGDHGPSSDSIFGAYDMQFATGFESDQNAIAESIAQLREHVDLAEPFGRIHEAIREAQRIGGRGTSANEQAA